jgi:hypothetical protein
MAQFFGYFALKKKFVSTALKNGVGAISWDFHILIIIKVRKSGLHESLYYKIRILKYHGK